MKRILLTLTLLLLGSTISLQALAQDPFDLPVGNYQQSCWGCTYNYRQLNCTCNDRNGRPHQTNLGVVRNCQFIQNINGQLTCTQLRHRYFRRHRHYTRHVRYYDAGTIVGNTDARAVCPGICYKHHLKWTGKWRKGSQFGFNAQCQCAK